MVIDKYRIKKYLQTVLLRCLQLLPIQKNKILFQSYYGEYYNDNPKAISDKLMDKGLELVWAVAKPLDCPSGIRQVNTSSLRYFIDLATSKVWVDNCRKRDWVRKRKSQFYIQTWHGNLGNKRAEGAAIDTLTPEYVARAKMDAKMTNLMISGSRFFSDLIRKYFWYSGEILECGTPRLDTFFQDDSNVEVTIRKELGIAEDKRIALYAPTFRKDYGTEYYKMNYNRILDSLERKTGDSWVMLIRLHPNVANKVDFIQYSSRLINATAFSDLYKLIPISDIVISDYSSLTFEAGLLDKPVFLFATDLDNYVKERGFYIDIRKQPYILVQSDEEFIEAIASFNMDEYLLNLHEFNESLGIMESGNAAGIIADRIMQEMKES